MDGKEVIRRSDTPPAFDQSEWSVADRGNRLATFHEGAHKRDGLLIHAQLVGTHLATRQEQRIIFVGIGGP
jgi:hypothetical protein